MDSDRGQADPQTAVTLAFRDEAVESRFRRWWDDAATAQDLQVGHSNTQAPAYHASAAAAHEGAHDARAMLLAHMTSPTFASAIGLTGISGPCS